MSKNKALVSTNLKLAQPFAALTYLCHAFAKATAGKRYQYIF
jgi:hypothetical protein